MGYSQKHKRVELSPKLKLGVGRGYSSGLLLKLSGSLFLLIAIGLAVNSLIIVLRDSPTEMSSSEPTPTVLGASDNSTTTPSDPISTYTVQKGDTIFSIAQAHGNINWSTIATLNNLNPPFTLQIGQTLKIPTP